MKHANAPRKDAAPSSTSGQTLRQRAEESAWRQAALPPEDTEALSPDEIRQTLHDLRVHQIELEMQNEELRRTQVELDEARARYFDLYDLAPVGYCTLSEKGLILEANLTAATLLGAARNALGKQPITRFIFKEDQDIYYLHRKRLVETGEPQACELRMVREDGTQFWARLEATAAQAADGTPVQRVVMSDITAGKRAELRLLQSEEHLKKSQEIAHLGSWELDLTNNQLTWSDEVCRIFGLEPQECGATYEAFLEAVHPEDRAAVDDAYTGSLREGHDVYEIEHRIVKKPNGEIRYVHEKCEHLRDRSGRVIRSVGMVHDITERKQMEETLLQHNQYLIALQETMVDLASQLDLNSLLANIVSRAGLLMQTSSGYLGLVEHGTDRIERQAGSGFLSGLSNSLAQEHEDLVRMVLRTGEPLVVDDYNVLQTSPHDSGQVVSCSAVGIPLLSSSRVLGSPVLGILALAHKTGSGCEFRQEDIRFLEHLARFASVAIENALLVEALRQSNTELQASNGELDAFGHTVAHDLKNPLTSIVWFASELADQEAPLSIERIRKLAPIMEETSLRMDTIIEELMLLAGLRKSAVKMAPLDMTHIVAEVQRRLTYMIQSYDAKIVSPPDWPQALGYAPWVEEIWINYISNAIKYGGRPPLIEVGAEQQGEWVRFCVRDNGQGLTAEQQTRLFRPFERLDQVSFKGYGLGLSIVQRIVERMNGQAKVESAGVPGEGANFYFILPAT